MMMEKLALVVVQLAQSLQLVVFSIIQQWKKSKSMEEVAQTSSYQPEDHLKLLKNSAKRRV
jgi:hypothetical protein